MSKIEQTTLSRRGFVSALGLLPWLPSAVGATAKSKNAVLSDVFINGHHDQAGNFFISGLNEKGKETFRVDIPEMPHGFAIHPQQPELLVSFPGLTGKKLVVMNTKQGSKVAEILIRPDRHFNGHGAFTPDGAFLVTTENDVETAEGIIGVYDGRTFEFIGEFPSYGLGPHGIRILPDGKTVVVANGGLKTHQSTGKFYTNLNTMRSSVTFIDLLSGELLEHKTIPVDRLSIRNMYLAENNQLLVTCQYWGKRQRPPLIGLIKDRQDIEMLDIDEESLWMMNNYTGGTVVSGNIAAVSCPRGNYLTFWDLSQKKHMGMVKIKDVSGVQPCAEENCFIASAETGKLYKVNAKSMTTQILSPVWQKAKWTNHMIKMKV